MPKILWIEDDYYHVKGLFRPLGKEGFTIVSATSANDAYRKVQAWREYDLIVVDIILPLRDQRANELLPEVKQWENEEYIGIGLLKYMYYQLQIKVPIIVLSVASDNVGDILEQLGVDEILLKRGLLPEQVQETVHEVLEKRPHEQN
jgi:CheY-like chemotaxis protein